MNQLKMKPLKWLGNSYARLKKFPKEAMSQAGYQLNKVQTGREPADWKPISSIGLGVMELRIHEPHEHRVIYVAKYAEAVYVLHVSDKKTQKTSDKDLKLARKIYGQLQKTREENYAS